MIALLAGVSGCGKSTVGQLLDSQLATLESPQPGEWALTVPAVGSADQVAGQIISGLGLA